ncbi:cytochrome P450 [Auricularia subglabra TFB-10046 SS5]|nr:cytochrome P450 [Auricularia subglabra TFB-10046 SS5]
MTVALSSSTPTAYRTILAFQFSIGVIALYAFIQVLWQVYAYWRKGRSPLRNIPGPHDGRSFLYGHLRLMLSGENHENLRGWAHEYGETFAIRGMLGSYQLITTDPRALQHVVFASHIFQRPESERHGIKKSFGEGVLYAEDEQHRRQRRIINPSFGFSHVRDMTEVFLETAAQLRDIWHNKCLEAGGTARVDVLKWMSKAALDAIGKAGFDYDFKNLDEHGEQTEMAAALEGVFRTDTTALEQVRVLLDDHFPLLRAIAPGKATRALDLSKKRMDEIGMRIVQEKKRAILDEMGAGPGRIEKKAVGGKDLISLLLKANLSADLVPSQRLSDREVLAQIPTFIVAGHETTSNSITWTMHSLALRPDVQKKLRNELLQVETDSPTLDVLNALPYLDHVVRETLRFYSVATFITREVVENDVIPLSTPITDIHGDTMNSIRQVDDAQRCHSRLMQRDRVQKGDEVQVPLYLINHSKTFFGPDVDEFRPERWDELPAEAASIPGITPNLMSFSGGPRSCVGHRFAVAEMKAFLFHIVRGFEFRLAVDPQELWSRTGVVLRPQLRGDNSIQLPVYLTPIA